MKPMVRSAAAAVRTPSAEPSVSAAPPCKRCRRVMLRKSMVAPLEAVPPLSRRGLVRGVLTHGFASFVPMHNYGSEEHKILKYQVYLLRTRNDRNLFNQAGG